MFSLALIATDAQAQNYHNVSPHIDGFNVDEVRRLVAGAELNFTLYGTPGGIATLRIAGARRNVALSEVDSGQYEGTYTISSRDSINARSEVTANLRLGNQVASTVLSESLQAGVGYHAPQGANGRGPNIERFDVQPTSALSGGNDLQFTLFGTPGGKADIAIGGTRGRFFLDEVKNGEYTGIYTIKNRDRISANSVVTANLRVGDRVSSATLGKPLLAAVAPPPRPARICSSCGVVEAVNVVEVNGEGGYLGSLGGGVVGALLGSQVGKGNGKTAAAIVGAVGGAYAGQQIEKNSNRSSHYEVLVRLQNGGTQTVSFASDPGYRIGDKVRITEGVLARE